MSDLVFFKPFDGSANLVFGDSSAPVVQHVDVTLDDQFDALVFEAVQIPDARIEVAFDLGEMSFEAEAEYKSRAQRPIVAKGLSQWQVAGHGESQIQNSYSRTESLKPSVDTTWLKADRCSAAATGQHADAMILRQGTRSRHQDAQRLDLGSHRSGFQDANRSSRNSTRTRFQQATPHVSAGRKVRHQDADRRPRSALCVSHQEAHPLRFTLHDAFQCATPFDRWGNSWYDNAKRPDAGTYVPPVEPPAPPGYGPTGDLLFAKLANGAGHLIFGDYGSVPEATVVIPVRSVYMVLNDVSLRRVSNNTYLPTLSLSLKIDTDSWTWGFSASLPADALSDIEPNAYGDPVELEAEINGNLYRVLVESVSRDRQFAKSSISVSGRGVSAYLDSPYAATRNFNNVADRTAQQLMNDALTINDVGIGWGVDWRITDWLVPAGIWSHQGTHISALKTIAAAAGAYLQPDPVQKIIRVLPRYVKAPWDWATLTPDFELPSALTTKEGTEWVEKARYNQVYVSGQSAGVLGQVRRAGTDGGTMAPMVVDSLITHADAARQRGISILSDTGRQANVSLRIPVLNETGIIEPGKVIKYVDDGVERIGIVRKNDVSVTFPQVFQSLGVETHVA